LNDSGKIDKSKISGISGFTNSLNLRNSTTEKILATLPKTLKIFQLIVNVEHSLGEFRRLLLPVFVKVLDDPEVNAETRRVTLCFLMHLANDAELHQFAPRIVHPLMRLLGSKKEKESTLLTAAITALSCLLCRLGANYAPYVIPVRRKMKAIQQREFSSKNLQAEEYETLVTRLLRQKSLPLDPSSAPDIAIRLDERMRTKVLSAKIATESPLGVYRVYMCTCVGIYIHTHIYTSLYKIILNLAQSRSFI
jgi:hypothetical protein